MNQWELEANTRNWRQAQENVCDLVMIGFGFAPDWLSMWRKIFKLITAHSKAKPNQFIYYFWHSFENRSITYPVDNIMIYLQQLDSDLLNNQYLETILINASSSEQTN